MALPMPRELPVTTAVRGTTMEMQPLGELKFVEGRDYSVSASRLAKSGEVPQGPVTGSLKTDMLGSIVQRAAAEVGSTWRCGPRSREVTRNAVSTEKPPEAGRPPHAARVRCVGSAATASRLETVTEGDAPEAAVAHLVDRS